MGKEIERKFIFNGDLNDFNILKTEYIEQTYLATGDQEVRIRKKTLNGMESCYLTIKSGNGISREESELIISYLTYKQIIKKLTSKPLRKIRNSFVWNGFTFEIDLYFDFKFKILEIEFTNEKDAYNFHFPKWLSLGEEVTSDSNYKNQKLWESIQ